MPRHYGRKRPYSKPFRRYGKKYGRSRWKNKKFSKFNNKSRASIKGLIMPKSAYVKLPWRRIATTTTINAGSQYSTIWVPTAYVPHPSNYSTEPLEIRAQAGDSFPNGLTQYAQFFDTGYVLGASLKLQIMNCNTVFAGGTTTPQILAILCAYPYNSSANQTPPLGQICRNVRDVYDYLEGLSNDNLQSLSFSQSRMVTLGYSKSEIFMKMFRKTKQMTGVKDIEDNDDMEINLPQNNTDFSVYEYGAPQGWLYYLRLVNLADSANAQVVRVNAKMTQYWKLTSRRAVLQGVATNP